MLKLVSIVPEAGMSAGGIARGHRVSHPSVPGDPPKPDTGDAKQASSTLASRIPFMRPNPPKLAALTAELAALDQSGIYSNYGPINTRLERAITDAIFGGAGACLTVCNATTGLMICIKSALRSRPTSAGRFALMPSFTFAATAHAASWTGLTPLLYDIEEDTWLPCPKAEEELLQRYGRDIAVMVPCATFGNCLDLRHYERLSERYGVPVVIDAAASLGCLTEEGMGFGAGSRHPVVYSMHATKTFATGEGGLIYCADLETVHTLRVMGNFGFGQPRTATMPGLNAKLSEVGALIALAKLSDFEDAVDHRSRLAEAYRARLGEFSFQKTRGIRHALQFMPVALAAGTSSMRDNVVAALAQGGIGAGAYFSPHLAEQPHFRETCVAADLTNTDALSRRIISLPLSDFMTIAEVDRVCAALSDAARC